MITVVLQGVLKEKFAKNYTLAVNSVREAVNALCLMVPDFKQEFMKYDYLVYSTLNKKRVYLESTELDSNLIVDKIYLVPKLAGAKSNTQKGVGKLILAAALFFVAGPMGAAWVSAGTTTAAGLSVVSVATLQAGAAITSAVTQLALFTALNGISSLLTPQPPKAVETKESSSISSENSASGGAVPLAYGETYFEVTPISVEIASSGMSQATNTTPTLPIVGGGFNWTRPEYEYLP